MSPAPTLTLVIDRVPITITYRYATDTWTVHHDDPDVRDAYETMFRDATDGAWSLLNRYAPHPQLDRIEELAKTWNIRVHGIAELRSWIASKPLLVERLY